MSAFPHAQAPLQPHLGFITASEGRKLAGSFGTPMPGLCLTHRTERRIKDATRTKQGRPRQTLSQGLLSTLTLSDGKSIKESLLHWPFIKEKKDIKRQVSVTFFPLQ